MRPGGMRSRLRSGGRMVDRLLRDKTDLRMWVDFLAKRKFPMRVSVVSGKPRSTEQNKLQRLWCREAAEQMGDRTPEEVRGEAKLTFGVPILRFEDEAFAREYDATVKPLPHELKFKLMMEPFDLAVTRRMRTDQKTRFLDAFYAHWTAQGVVLTVPPDDRYGPKIGDAA